MHVIYNDEVWIYNKKMGRLECGNKRRYLHEVKMRFRISKQENKVVIHYACRGSEKPYVMRTRKKEINEDEYKDYVYRALVNHCTKDVYNVRIKIRPAKMKNIDYHASVLFMQCLI